MWNLKKKYTNELNCKIEKYSDIENRGYTGGYQGWNGGNGEMLVTRYKDSDMEEG